MPRRARDENREDGDSRNRKNGSNETEHQGAAYERDDDHEGMETYRASEYDWVIDGVLDEVGEKHRRNHPNRQAVPFDHG